MNIYNDTHFSFQMLATITAIYVISFLKACNLTPLYNMQPAYITANIGNYVQFINYSYIRHKLRQLMFDDSYSIRQVH